jgi:hypothetical protein
VCQGKEQSQAYYKSSAHARSLSLPHQIPNENRDRDAP